MDCCNAHSAACVEHLEDWRVRRLQWACAAWQLQVAPAVDAVAVALVALVHLALGQRQAHRALQLRRHSRSARVLSPGSKSEARTKGTRPATRGSEQRRLYRRVAHALVGCAQARATPFTGAPLSSSVRIDCSAIEGNVVPYRTDSGRNQGVQKGLKSIIKRSKTSPDSGKPEAGKYIGPPRTHKQKLPANSPTNSGKCY